MLRLLILSLMFVPAAQVIIPAVAPSAHAEMSQATEAASASAARHQESAEDTSNSTPMQEEIIADHHAVSSPFVESMWTRLVLLPATPLFPIDLVDLFRPPQGTRA